MISNQDLDSRPKYTDEAKKILKEKDTRYCARCKKSTKKGTLDAKYIGRVEYCKVCHSRTKNGKVIVMFSHSL